MSEKNIVQLIVGPIAANCWIYPFGRSAAVIDPGADASLIISTLEKLNLTPVYILLSHGHFDHIGAVPALVKAFPEILIAIHSQDSHYLGEQTYETQCQSMKAAIGSSTLIDESWKEMPAAGRLLEDGDKIACGESELTVLHIPGHTQGSAAFYDEKTGVIFTGDTLFHRGYGRTDLPGGDEDQIFESLDRLFTLEPGIIVYPGHGRKTTIGQEAKR